MNFNKFRNSFKKEIHDFYYFEKDECGSSWLENIEDWTDYELHCYLRFKNDPSMFEKKRNLGGIFVNGVPLQNYLYGEKDELLEEEMDRLMNS